MLKKYFQKRSAGKPFLYLRIKVIPKSAKNQVVDIMNDETIKIRIKAAPEQGKANAALIEFLSKELNVLEKNVLIISGAHDPLKLIKVKLPL
ncbi:DUF167 domain-containing protein [Candidatus Peregrinibacteria bacterium]|nr:DUF167 domain-containing protein [Candidatus Peregrinibacteria bacterium]